MKKLIAFICSLFLCFLITLGIKEFYAYEIHFNYYDKAAEILTDNKFKSISLQKESIARGDNLLMYGSSEFEAGVHFFSHPFKFFNNKKDGYQVNLIGKAGSKSLVHAIDFGALGSKLKGQKVVFILSPQWFVKGGTTENTLEARTSEFQVDEFLLNPEIPMSEKQYVANRILNISKKKPNKDFESMRNFCKLYSNNNMSTKILKVLAMPYYWSRYELLSIKEEMMSYKVLINNKRNTIIGYKFPSKANFDWESELDKAVQNARMHSTNEFAIADNSLKYMTKGNLAKFKDSMKNKSYDVSPEYNDFKLLLNVCKKEGIKPLIVSVPVNGKWYDYCGFSKNDRQIYYKNVNNIIKQYGFDEADFSNHEYDDYFLTDGSHLGWKGWIYVDKAIDQYYHKN